MIRSRRRFLQGMVSGVGLAATPGIAATLTPRQSAGPFYPEQLPLDNDNDLVRVGEQTQRAQGQVSDLSGRLLDRNGRAIQDTRIEIWQCDANGRYRHSRDPGQAPIDAGFQGFGRTSSDEQGRYRFRTIRPVPYPGRTPHIHVAVFPDGDQPFVTQLYVAGEQRNASDFLYQRLSEGQQTLVTAAFLPSAGADAELAADWDIILGVG